MRSALVGAALLALPSAARAQVRFRSELGAELSPVKRWEFSVAERLTVGDGIADGGRWQTLVGAHFSPWRFLSFGVGYRLTGEAAYMGPRFRHRALAEGMLSARWRRFRFGWRARWQGLFDDNAAELEFDAYLRNRLSVRWNSPIPLDVTASAELFSDISGVTTEALDRIRIEAGVTAHVRWFAIGAGYRYDTPWLGTATPYHMAMVSLTWQWSRRAGNHRPAEPPATAP